MNDIENRLRDAYRDATDTVRPEAIRGLNDHATVFSPSAGWWTRGALHRLMVPLTAAAAVLVISVVAAAVVPNALHDARNQGNNATVPLAGNPATHFLVGLAGDSLAGYLSVRSAITGAPVATLTAPPGRFFGVAATADGGSYVVTVKKPGNCGTWLYRFTISRKGQPSRLTPFRPGYLETSIEHLAISRNGRAVAFAGIICTRWQGAVHLVVGGAELGVINIKQTSYAASYKPVPSHTVVNSLSLTADGRQLELSTALTTRSPSDIYVFLTNEILESPDLRSRVVVKAARFGASTTINSSVMSPDGRTIYFTTYKTGRVVNGRWALRAVDVASGRSRLITQKRGLSVYIVANPSVRELMAFAYAVPPLPVLSGSPVPSGSPSAVPSSSPPPTQEPSGSPSSTPILSSSPPSVSPATASLEAVFTTTFDVIRIQVPGGRVTYLNPLPWNVLDLVYVW